MKPANGGFLCGNVGKWIVPVIDEKIWLRTKRKCAGKMFATDFFELVLRRFCPGCGLIFSLRRCIVVSRCGREGRARKKIKGVS